MVSADPQWGALAGRGAESRFVTASDGVRLHYLRWFGGRSPPRAVVIFLHGIASHGGWFGETAAELNDRGVAVYAPDRRGSGRSGGPRGHLARYGRALDDVDEVVRLVCSEHRGTPVFLAASSWAAKLAVVYAARRRAPQMANKMVVNGLGRIGRAALKSALQQPELELVAVNEIGSRTWCTCSSTTPCTGRAAPGGAGWEAMACGD
jgi:alpha-beta hydrolase superfamily lysophospholipase